MVQSIKGFGLAGGGIVAVLIIAGILVSATGTDAGAGSLAISAGITIGIILGVLGIIGVIISLSKRVM